MTITIPENISDITISQFKKWDKLNKRKDVTDTEYNKRAISIFTNLPYHTISKIKQSDYKELVSDIIKALETPAPFKDRFVLNGINYGFIPNFDKMTQGEFIDLTEYQNDSDNLNKLMAVLFRPITKTDKLGNYKIQSYDGTKERAIEFEDMTMDVVNGALGFFLTLSKGLQKAIQRSTNRELAKVARHSTTLKSGDGMQPSLN